jgi:cytochrome b6-f complex iron-sulfur subunit
MSLKGNAENSSKPSAGNDNEDTRRDFLTKIIIGMGVVFGYGLFAAEGLLFLLPRRKKPPTIKIYAGRLNQYKEGSVQTYYDLEGNEIMIKRDSTGLKAFSTVCPHLGCRVHWQADKNEFFCPCHKGVFDSEGVAISGPPASAGQKLGEVSIEVDKASQVVYLEVKEPKRNTG